MKLLRDFFRLRAPGASFRRDRRKAVVHVTVPASRGDLPVTALDMHWHEGAKGHPLHAHWHVHPGHGG